jgi:hypothetical protein
MIGETKREGQKMNHPQEPKKGSELVLLVIGSYLTHNPSNVICMQMRSNNNGRFKTSITCQRSLPFYDKG